jgi:hypothetical protein
MTVDEWVETFKPIKNPNNDWGGDYSAFETFSPDVTFVSAQPDNLIWTEIDGDGGCYIISGYHLVNRIQYYVATVPFPKDAYIEAVVCLYKECDCIDEDYEADPDCAECESGGTVNVYAETRADLIEIYGEEYANASI